MSADIDKAQLQQDIDDALDGDWQSDAIAATRELVRIAPPNEFLQQQKLVWTRQQNFLAGFVATGTITGGCRVSGLKRQAYYDWTREDSLGFVDRFAKARELFVEVFLESKLFQVIREMKPGQNPIPLIFALKAHKPEKYGDKITLQDDTGKALVDRLRALADQPAVQAKVEEPGGADLAERLKLRESSGG